MNTKNGIITILVGLMIIGICGNIYTNHIKPAYKEYLVKREAERLKEKDVEVLQEKVADVVIEPFYDFYSDFIFNKEFRLSRNHFKYNKIDSDRLTDPLMNGDFVYQDSTDNRMVYSLRYNESISKFIYIREKGKWYLDRID